MPDQAFGDRFNALRGDCVSAQNILLASNLDPVNTAFTPKQKKRLSGIIYRRNWFRVWRNEVIWPSRAALDIGLYSGL